MANDPRDPRDRRTPPGGLPRAVTEKPVARTSTRERDQLVLKHAVPVEIHQELTPITRIEMVRAELKDDIAVIRTDVSTVEEHLSSLSGEVGDVKAAVERLSGSVETSNEQMPIVLEIIKNELAAKRDTDHVVVTTKMDVERHRAIAEIDTGVKKEEDVLAARAAKRKERYRLVSLLTSTSLITAIVTALLARC